MMNFQLTTAQVASIVGAKLVGNPEKVLTGVAPLEHAGEQDLSFYARGEYATAARHTKAGAVLTSEQLEDLLPGHVVRLYHPTPDEAFITFIDQLLQQTKPVGGFIHHTVSIAPSSTIGKSVRIAAGAVIGENCIIDEEVEIGMSVCIEDYVQIGYGTVIESGAIIRSRSVIGRCCRIGSGAVVGSEGFGYIERRDGSLRRIPHLGNVMIQDNVEIGANTCIDRATFGSTLICSGAKIDNLVHVAHNVVVGENTALAAQVGIAGSTKVGKNNKIGGQVGIVGHITTADSVVIGAQSGVSKSIFRSGHYSGTPAVELSRRLRSEAAIRRLVEMLPSFELLLQMMTPYRTDQIRDDEV